MGKRSDGTFERNPRDFYPTPREAVLPLLDFLPKNATFAEPCCGEFDLVLALEMYDRRCNFSSDIEARDDLVYVLDALELTEKEVEKCDYIITNPPWDRKILHPMINHFRSLKPTWLLFDSDWAHTRQASPYLPFCSDIVAVGRVKWIPGSKHTGKDNCCWYKFINQETETVFHGRS